MKLSLVPVELVDKGGIEVRLSEDIAQLGFRRSQITHKPPEGFTDLGEVEYDGAKYYASTYQPPIPIISEERLRDIIAKHADAEMARISGDTEAYEAIKQIRREWENEE
jgi:alkanesulfonate monooxygenase SsuD/methylene tetrahydromethanopterin reductase-like flavin-dependent oxidoreductase (luciferase family)